MRRALLGLLLLAVSGFHQPRAAAEDGCAAVFRGADCSQSLEDVPCWGKAFTEPLTLHQGYLGANLKRKGDNTALEAVRKAMEKPMRNQYGIEMKTVQDVIAQFPETSFYKKGESFASCALVGSSPVLRDASPPLGPEIDRHELVARMNNAPTTGYEEYVGKKTTLRFLGTRYTKFRNEAHVISISRYCSPIPEFESNTSAPLKTKWNNECKTLDRWPKVLAGELRKKVHPLNEEFETYVRMPFRQHTPPADPSSGLKTLGLLLHVCQSVDLYGFVASTKANHSGYLSWYYEKYPGYKKKPPRKRFATEHPELVVGQDFKDLSWTFLPKPTSDTRLADLIPAASPVTSSAIEALMLTYAPATRRLLEDDGGLDEHGKRKALKRAKYMYGLEKFLGAFSKKDKEDAEDTEPKAEKGDHSKELHAKGKKRDHSKKEEGHHRKAHIQDKPLTESHHRLGGAGLHHRSDEAVCLRELQARGFVRIRVNA